jgi:hypothetical protein
MHAQGERRVELRRCQKQKLQQEHSNGGCGAHNPGLNGVAGHSMEQCMKTTTLLASAVALAFTFGVAMAQTKDKAPAKPRTAESIECSKQADAKGLHGKERKVFRAKCKKDLAKPANKPA